MNSGDAIHKKMGKNMAFFCLWHKAGLEIEIGSEVEEAYDELGGVVTD